MEIRYTKSNHSVLYERYNPKTREYESPPGEQGDQGWIIDPDTGAEYHALVGPEGGHTRDWKVGNYYPKAGFLLAEPNTSHESLREFLIEYGLWDNHLTKITIPDAGFSWVNGFQYKPVETAVSMQSMENRMKLHDLETEPLGNLIYAWPSQAEVEA